MDAAALTDISLKWLAKENPQAGVEVTTGFTPKSGGKDVVSAGGFAFDNALGNIRKSGQWVQIATPFGFSPANVPPAGLTSQTLCTAA